MATTRHAPSTPSGPPWPPADGRRWWRPARVGPRWWRPLQAGPRGGWAPGWLADPRVGLLALGGLAGLAILVIQLAELALPLSSDQALYSLIGRAIHDGSVPYRDLPDLKPPGIFYVRAVLDALAPVSWSGACFAGPLHASCGWVVVKLADVLSTLLFGAGLYAAARVVRFERGAAFVSAILGMLYVSLSYVSQLGLTPEKLAAGCAALAVVLAGHGRWLAAGGAVGLAVLMKQPGGTALVPVVLLALARPTDAGTVGHAGATPPVGATGHSGTVVHTAATSTARTSSGPDAAGATPGSQPVLPPVARPSGRGRRVALVLAGFAAPLALVAAVLAVQGGLGAAIEYVLTINLERIRTPASAGGFGGDNAPQFAWQAFKNGLAPFWLLGMAGLLASGRLTGRGRLVLLGWALVDGLLLLRLRELLQLAPSVALLGGWGASCVWQAAGQPPYLGFGRARPARLALLGGLASLVALSSGYQAAIVMRAFNERSVRGFVRSPDEFVAEALAQVPPERLFVWGNGTELYLLSGRAPASASLNAIPLSANLPAAAARRARLMDELRASRPVAIVLSPEVDRVGDGLAVEERPGDVGFPALRALLEDAYAPLAEVTHNAKYGGWRIYVRRMPA